MCPPYFCHTEPFTGGPQRRKSSFLPPEVKFNCLHCLFDTHVFVSIIVERVFLLLVPLIINQAHYGVYVETCF